MNWLKQNWFKILPAMMLLIALGEFPYGYYQLLRWVVTISAGYSAYLFYEFNKKIWVWIFIAIAILFNPVTPFFLEKSTWQLLDLIGAIIFLLSIFAKNMKTKRT